MTSTLSPWQAPRPTWRRRRSWVWGSRDALVGAARTHQPAHWLRVGSIHFGERRDPARNSARTGGLFC